MIRAFIDSSVFFSACFSPRGASRAIMHEAAPGIFALVVSDVVMDEVSANLAEISEARLLLDVFDLFRQTIPFEEVHAHEQAVEEAAR